MSQGKAILIVSQSFFPVIGGVSSFLVGLVCGLVGLGYRVHVLHFRVRGSGRFMDLYPQVRQHDIDAATSFSATTMERYAVFKEDLYRKLHGLDPTGIGELNAIDGYAAYREVTEVFARHATAIVREYEIEILNVHDYQLFPVLDIRGCAKKLLNIHTPILPSYPYETLQFLRRLALKADRTVVSTPAYYEVLANDQTKDILQVTCLPPFVDNNLQRALCDAAGCNTPVPDRKFIVTSIQRFDAKSGHQQLIRGFASFVAKHPEALLVLVGGPSFTDSIADIRHRYYQEAKDLTAALDIQENVFFAGSVPYQCLGEVYSRTQVFCMLSRNECFGLALTEAMSRQVPAVVTAVGGLGYQIRNGVDGVTVAVDDPAGVASALEFLHEHPALGAQYAASAYERYLDLFHPAAVMRQYDALLQSL